MNNEKNNSSWYYIVFTEEELEQETKLKTDFSKCKETSNLQHLSLFCSDNKKEMKRVYFFPQEHNNFCLSLLNKGYNFNPCNKPDNKPLITIIGDKADYDFWFN